ncbi:TonB-dependent receptor [Catenovulum adriaticum]|uniref:TonB-dependent receptor n=1 Tax=Catenovulum adriaticum TaxID=2984846 RepID=A0ABY7AQJ9_9ALTE|nr:TonB-dependent receptor [Catenovulum sp. TS8]WAJ71819.1 TonB-dependent receptor [Catenovulum sp. TS8]
MNNKSSEKRPFSGNLPKVSTIATLVAATLSGQVTAQESQTQQSSNVEVIEITGIRASLKKSLNTKRFADTVVDAVSAEDIGKFPDENVAESLQRITGIQLNRGVDNAADDNFGSGEGTQVSVRGIRPDLNLIRFKGVSVAPNTINRNFDFSILAPALVSKLKVYKTPSADLQEGGIGGTIDVETLKPLTNPKRKLVGSYKVTYPEINQEPGYRASALYSEGFMDDTLGVVLSINFQDVELQRHRYETAGWIDRPIEGTTARVPRNFRYNNRSQQKDRTGIYGAIQWQPSDTLEFELSHLFAEEDMRDFGSQPIYPAEVNPAFTRTNAVLTAAGEEDEFDRFLSFDAVSIGPTRRLLAIDRDFTLGLKSTALGMNWTPSYSWSIDAKAAISEGKFEQYQYFMQFWGNDDFSISHTDAGQPPLLSANQAGDPSVNGLLFENPERYYMNVSNLLDRRFSNDMTDIALDFTRDLDFTYVPSIKFGYRYTDVEHVAFRQRIDGNPIVRGLEPRITLDKYIDLTDPEEFSASRVGGVEYIPNINISSLTNDVSQLYDPADFSSNGSDLAANYAINEAISAAYFRVNYELSDNIRGNFGVRYVETEQISDGFDSASREPVKIKQDYNDTLPSFNIVYQIADDMLLRGAAAKTISRAPLQDLNPGGNINEEAGPPATANLGNPFLEPFRANQLDLSYEWYFSETSLFSVALFKKDMESFIVKGFDQRIVPGFEDLGELDVTQPVNGQGADIKGLEVSLQGDFSFITDELANFGYIANYTAVDGEMDEDGSDVPGISDTSYNLSVFWENDVFSVRTSYNFRSNYVTFPQYLGFPVYRDGRGQVDMNASYKLNENVSFIASAVNITGEETYDYHATESNFMNYTLSGPIYNVGIRARF